MVDILSEAAEKILVNTSASAESALSLENSKHEQIAIIELIICILEMCNPSHIIHSLYIHKCAYMSVHVNCFDLFS